MVGLPAVELYKPADDSREPGLSAEEVRRNIGSFGVPGGPGLPGVSRGIGWGR
jgi:hypothetical protein